MLREISKLHGCPGRAVCSGRGGGDACVGVTSGCEKGCTPPQPSWSQPEAAAFSSDSPGGVKRLLGRSRGGQKKIKKAFILSSPLPCYFHESAGDSANPPCRTN